MGSWARGGPGLQRCKQLKLDYLLTARLENRRINAVRRGVGLLMQRLFKSSSKYCAFERLRWSVSRKRWGFRIRGRRLSALALHVSVGRSVGDVVVNVARGGGSSSGPHALPARHGPVLLYNASARAPARARPICASTSKAVAVVGRFVYLHCSLACDDLYTSCGGLRAPGGANASTGITLMC